MSEALAIVEEMIEEIFTPRKSSPPVMGGGKPAPFDGEILGKFIRYAVLIEVKEKLSGGINPRDLSEEFWARWKKVKLK